MAIETTTGGLAIKLPFFIKLALVVVAVFLAFVFSGDIDENGRLKINLATVTKFAGGVSIGLTAAPFFIRYFEFHDYADTEQGFIYFLCSVFGQLIIGIFYRSLEMLRGKTFVEIIQEMKSAIKAIAS